MLRLIKWSSAKALPERLCVLVIFVAFFLMPKIDVRAGALPLSEACDENVLRLVPARAHLNEAQELQALRYLYYAKVFVNSAAIQKDKSDYTSRLLFTVTGQHLTGVALWKRLSRRFEGRGGYDAAIETAGLPLENIRLQQKWSKQLVIEQIQMRAGAGKALNAGSVTIDPECFNLEAAAIRHFGSWDAALEASGFDPEQIRLVEKWSQEKVVAKIQKGSGEISLNSGAIHDDNSERTKDVLGVSGVRLYSAALRHFPGRWSEALFRAEQNVQAIQIRSTRYFEKVRTEKKKPKSPKVIRRLDRNWFRPILWRNLAVIFRNFPHFSKDLQSALATLSVSERELIKAVLALSFPDQNQPPPSQAELVALLEEKLHRELSSEQIAETLKTLLRLRDLEAAVSEARSF